MSFFISIPLWGWFDIGFNIAVLIALGGETEVVSKWLFPERYDDLVPPQSKRNRLKKCCEWLLIFGTAGEICCLPFSLCGTADAERQAGQANERAAKFEKEAADLYKIGEESKAELEKSKAARLELEKQVLTLAAC